MLGIHHAPGETTYRPYIGDDDTARSIPGHAGILKDDRFRRLLGESGWRRLPAPVRERFGKRLQHGDSIAYQGHIQEMAMSRTGYLFAQACRLIGAPLPYDRDSINAPAVVIVTEDTATEGQFWIRQYGRKRGFPQTVHSSKRFDGPTGLEEYIGYGIGMALTVEATETALLFRSDHYYVTLFGRRLRLPAWLNPGDLTIGHHERGNGRFAFTLSLAHPLLGTLIRQTAIFSQAKEYVYG